ncbi:MAG TPA: M14 family zinc carboxypeptidase [Planctomycetota bacterium]|nr:M14 family zinc carboxypeptidase [Planctomycetota bacterium]HRR81749.1 M14 family zinc carboxypeptidase [Planctomycetota bacterium]HRT94184.1 M14 family zinc carboxypeptidase [Planctomycetota bacterium]
MRVRGAIWRTLLALAALAIGGAPGRGRAAEGAAPDGPGAETPKPKGKGPSRETLKLRTLKDGIPIVGLRVKAEAAAEHGVPVGTCLEVRRGNRLAGYAEIAKFEDNWPCLTFLLGSGRAEDDLLPVTAPVPYVQLLTDERDALEAKELKALLADRLVVAELSDRIALDPRCTARIVILHGGIFFMGGDPIAQPFAREGHLVIVDTLAYSHIKGEVADETKFKEPTTLRTVREEGFTIGFPPESRIPWYGKKGKGYVARYIAGIPQADQAEKLLATDASTKNSALLEVDLGGRLAVMDLITPTGRAGRDPGAKNKLIFAARALGSGPRYARYLPSKPEYDDVLKWFDDLAEKHKDKLAKAFEGGAGKKEDFIYSYTLGAKDGPLIVLAGALRGTHWLGSAALLRLAEVLLDNPENDPKIDWLLERTRIRILPILNVHGYRHNQDPNENGVDLDRNFAYQWDEYADKKARGREAFCEEGSVVVRNTVEKEKAAAFLEISVDDYDAGYRFVRARDGSAAHQALLHGLVSVLNARLRYRFVVGDQMLQLRVTRDAERPSAANWAGSKGVLAASLRICGDGEDSITNQDVAVEACLLFAQAAALSLEKPEPPPEPPKKAPRPPAAKKSSK